ncbi:hypothetical protein BWI17_00065 [Betaproteobacteria bacterium GR16-43]|nr:hypothetical protein BWI17_00065 [Betaproteobacteria bacterium GR16-43]
MRVLAAVLVSLSLAGCFGPALKESYFVLSATEGAGAQPGAASPSVYVGAVTIPEAVDRLAMVIGTGANRVEIDDANRWAEPLRSAIPRVLAENLRKELGTSSVASGRAASQAVDFKVAVDIQRFDSSLESGATLDATWIVTPSKGGPARTGRTVVTEPASTREAFAAAHSRALARLARDLAEAIRR